MGRGPGFDDGEFPVMRFGSRSPDLLAVQSGRNGLRLSGFDVTPFTYPCQTIRLHRPCVAQPDAQLQIPLEEDHEG
jgi:hypothetical protein